MQSIILKVVLVLGIIIAGGFLLFFMADILMAIFNGKKDEKVIKANETKEVKKVEEQLSETNKEDASAIVNGAVIESYDPNADEEIAPIAEEVVETVEEESEEEVEEEEEETEPEDDREAYIEARRKALMERLAKMNETEDEEEEEESEETDEEETEELVDLDEEESEEVEEEVSEEEAAEIQEEDEAEAEESVSSEELEEARRALEAERAKSAALAAELAQAKQQNAAKAGEPAYLSEEEYEARIAVLNERLKLNEKELRNCKKEYMPLRRVQRTLENDEKKLRRKEALVAKQKVVLYGVNNYADIDQEKADKLAEDLDHLDGLKLSVEDCRQVMEKNKERYPLLERMYNVLSEQNENLKADLARAEKELEEVKAKKSN